jgi:hypothetical protein
MQAQQMLLLACKYAHIYAHIYASGIQALGCESRLDKQVFLAPIKCVFDPKSKTLKFVSFKTFLPWFFNFKISKSGPKDKDIKKITIREYS